MGSPLSPAAANIYMEFFEKEFARSLGGERIVLWRRYVDDVFLIFNGTEAELREFVERLNENDMNLRFTIELEKEKGMPFLDCLVSRLGGGKLSTSVYQKPTHTNRYLNAFSNHHIAIKGALAKTLRHRAMMIHQGDAGEASAIARIGEALILNGYSQSFADRHLKSRRGAPIGVDPRLANSLITDASTGQRPVVARIPYIKGLSESIAKIHRLAGIRTVFESRNSLQMKFAAPQNEVTMRRRNVVYEVGCSCFPPWYYVGETTRRLKRRFDEHRKNIATANVRASPLAEHVAVGGCRFKFEEAKILAYERDAKRLRVEEALEIAKGDNLINRSAGVQLSNAWRPLLGLNTGRESVNEL